jgi:hypothetical protein
LIKVIIMKIKFCYLILLVTTAFAACTKDGDEEPDPIPCNIQANENFSANINSIPWKSCYFKAVYYTKRKLLSVAALDSNYRNELRFFITLDTVNPLKNYLIGPHTTSGFEILADKSGGQNISRTINYCDIDRPSIGAIFNLTKLDTVAKKLSATFSANGYSLELGTMINIQSGVIDNIKLDTSQSTFADNSYASATINGTNWYGKGMFKKITLTAGGQDQFLSVKIPGYYIDNIGFQDWARNYNNNSERYLSLQIPLSTGTGTFQLYPERMPYSSQPLSTPYHIFSHNIHNGDKKFYPINGTITITHLDMALRNLDATFSTQTKDTNNVIINFANGKIHIVNWEPF